MRYLLRFALNVVTDERAAEAIGGRIGKAAMHQRSMEEQDVTGIHKDGLRRVPFRDGDGDVGEALGRIRRGCAEDGPMVAARHHLQTAVRLVTGIEREPSRQTGARLNAQIEVVLMQCLSPRARRFEIEHGLDGEGFNAEQRLSPCLRERRASHPRRWE
ncbi:MAG TPA: hypothetical protein VJ821_11800 [Anaerolineales bacterium]|nr:hypothetical protein [Anaerolineales bacterium]